jgi:hypothetical protein
LEKNGKRKLILGLSMTELDYDMIINQYKLFDNYVLLLSVYDYSNMNLLPKDIMIYIANLIISHNPHIIKGDSCIDILEGYIN